MARQPVSACPRGRARASTIENAQTEESVSATKPHDSGVGIGGSDRHFSNAAQSSTVSNTVL